MEWFVMYDVIITFINTSVAWRAVGGVLLMHGSMDTRNDITINLLVRLLTSGMWSHIAVEKDVASTFLRIWEIYVSPKWY
jgi:hypothetical protein